MLSASVPEIQRTNLGNTVLADPSGDKSSPGLYRYVRFYPEIPNVFYRVYIYVFTYAALSHTGSSWIQIVAHFFALIFLLYISLRTSHLMRISLRPPPPDFFPFSGLPVPHSRNYLRCAVYETFGVLQIIGPIYYL